MSNKLAKEGATPAYYAEVAEKAVREMRRVLFEEKLTEKEAVAVLSLIGVNLRTVLDKFAKDAEAS